jgi:hypothetical protein
MALGDIKIKRPVDQLTSVRRIVGSGSAASINPGEPTKEGSAGAVAIMVDADGTTSQRFSGIAKSVSTDTASAAGEVYVFLPLPGIVYSAKAKSSTAANTVAKIDALMGSRVVFDLTTAVWTVDSAAGDSATNGVVIVGGDPKDNTLEFVVSVSCTMLE